MNIVAAAQLLEIVIRVRMLVMLYRQPSLGTACAVDRIDRMRDLRARHHKQQQLSSSVGTAYLCPVLWDRKVTAI